MMSLLARFSMEKAVVSEKVILFAAFQNNFNHCSGKQVQGSSGNDSVTQLIITLNPLFLVDKN